MKPKTKLIIVLAVEFIAISIVLLLIFFAGKKSYTVTFDLNGGILLSGDTEQRVTQGQNATPPSTAKEGHYLMGWSGSYTKVTRNVTVRAIWEYETTPGIQYSDSENMNYCEIIGTHKELRGEVYVGAYHGGKIVLGITDSAFKDRKGITAIHLLDGILSIGDEAFAGCESLEAIDIPSTVVTIGEGAFRGCKNLKSITLPEGLETIEAGAFSGCESLEEIIIPWSVLRIGVGAFDTEGLTVLLHPEEPKKESAEDNGKDKKNDKNDDSTEDVTPEEEAPAVRDYSEYADGWYTEGVTVKFIETSAEDESDGSADGEDGEAKDSTWRIFE